ncbi:hypothetical protein E0H75_08740 [Kribbella capetownensis]|uniref:Uncharacterized protein n=1 Tax=Kribbella capetownensis TaxID=1572659 RepID=A0A4R0K360_9ACTN|nr:hypothetical protein [Kribbella capetownensis]TCC53750.1 hypothetical protein E0H75_08740 [Kribbella capetownensis]
MAAADPGGEWIKQVDRGILPKTYCGPTSTEGKRVSERMARGFTEDMAMSRTNVDKVARPAAAKIIR